MVVAVVMVITTDGSVFQILTHTRLSTSGREGREIRRESFGSIFSCPEHFQLH